MNSKRKANNRVADEARKREDDEQHRREWEALPPLKLGDFIVPKFDDISAVFGANLCDYPPMNTIPEEFKNWHNKYSEIVSGLFFKGGRLEDHGIRLKPDIPKVLAMPAIHAWMSSFAPQHEHKTATVAWALSQWTEPTS